MLDFNYVKNNQSNHLCADLAQFKSPESRNHSQTWDNSAHPSLPPPSLPPLLTWLTFLPPLLLPPSEQCKKGVPLCLPVMTSMESDCAWNTMGRHKSREGGVLYFFLEVIGLGVIFTLALPLCPAQLRKGCLDTVSWTHDTYQAANHPVRTPSQRSPLPLQFPPRKTHMSKHIHSLKMSYNLK